jgi:hypothetical protein
LRLFNRPFSAAWWISPPVSTIVSVVVRFSQEDGSMPASRTALFGALASAALLAGTVAAFAQNRSPQADRLIAVPPGAVVLVLPAGAGAVPVPAAEAVALPFPDMPSPFAMMRQMDQMMAEMQHDVALQAAALRDMQAGGLPAMGGPVAGVVVTSFSDGHGTCTRRITYRGDGSAPVVQVSASGAAACAGAGLPVGAPAIQAPDRASPHLIQVRNQTRPAAPLTLAQAGE